MVHWMCRFQALAFVSDHYPTQAICSSLHSALLPWSILLLSYIGISAANLSLYLHYIHDFNTRTIHVIRYTCNVVRYNYVPSSGHIYHAPILLVLSPLFILVCSRIYCHIIWLLPRTFSDKEHPLPPAISTPYPGSTISYLSSIDFTFWVPAVNIIVCFFSV